MSERTTQATDNATKSGQVSACPVNGDRSELRAGLRLIGAAFGAVAAALATKGGGLRADLTPPTPSRERHSPLPETRIGGGTYGHDRGLGGVGKSGSGESGDA